MNKGYAIFNSDYLRRRRFAHSPGVVCGCSEEYSRRVSDQKGGGFLRIAHTECLNGKQDYTCPVMMAWWRGGKVAVNAKGERFEVTLHSIGTAQKFDAVLKEWGIIDQDLKVYESEKIT